MKYLYVILIILFFSCSSSRNITSDFSDSQFILNGIDGTYISSNNKYDGLSEFLSLFNILDYTNHITLTLDKNTNEIRLTYLSDSTKKEVSFKGEIKNNKYFEIYFSKKRILIPLIFANYDINRIRIGKTKNGNLLVRNYINNSGHLLILAAGGQSVEYPYEFPCLTQYKDLTPIKHEKMWGYSDSLGNISISPKYDFVCTFEQDVARAKYNNKWGLINRKGEEITPIKYDWINPIDTLSQPAIFRAGLENKTGILATTGKEIIPVIYDYIGYTSSMDDIIVVHLGNKKGFAQRDRVIVPAIYSDVHSFQGNQALVKRNGKYFKVDLQGYEYETSGFWVMRDPKPKTKRKILFSEQELNK